MSRTKKILISVFGVVCMLLIGITLTACGGGNTQPSKESYQITYADGEWYNFSSRTTRQTEGEIATFTLENEPFIQIDKVYANDIERTEYKDKNFRIFFSDKSGEYVYGSVYSETQIEDFVWEDLDNGTKTFTFQYNPDHKFTVNVAYEYYVDKFQDYRYNYFTIDRGAEEDGEVKFDFNGDNVEVSFNTSNLAEEIV